MPTAAARAGMTGVRGAIVDDVNIIDFQCSAQALLDQLNTLLSHAGNTLRKGLTSTA